MEIGQGDWSGRTHTEIAGDDAERYAAWRAGGGQVTPPGGETLEEATNRIVAALDELTTDGEATLCLVSHGGILRLAAGHLLRLPPLEAWALDVDNASVSRLTRQAAGEPWRIEAWNDTAHLLGHARPARGRVGRRAAGALKRAGTQVSGWAELRAGADGRPARPAATAGSSRPSPCGQSRRS